MTKQMYMLVLPACLIHLSAVDSSLAEEEKDDVVRNCISTRTLKKTAVVDDLNILFIKVGNTIYHNILPRSCRGLSKSGYFSYTTLSGSLCSFDTIQVIDAFGREGRSCRLGSFRPISIEDLPDIINAPRGPTVPQPQPPADTEEIIVEDEEPG